MSDQVTPEGTEGKAVATVTPEKIEELIKRNEELQTLLDKTVNEAKSEREKKRKAAEASGEYEKALELKNIELTEAKAEADRLKVLAAEAEVLKAAATELEEIKAKQRTKLIEQLPEDKREKYKALDLNTLESIVEDFIGSDAKVSLPKNGASSPKGGAKKWAEMTNEERASFAAEHTSEDIAALMRG